MSTASEVADEHDGDEAADLHRGGDQPRPQTPDLKPLLYRRDHTIHVACVETKRRKTSLFKFITYCYSVCPQEGAGGPHVDTYGPVQICSLGTATSDLFELVHGGHISSKSNLARNSELITVLKVCYT